MLFTTLPTPAGFPRNQAGFRYKGFFMISAAKRRPRISTSIRVPGAILVGGT